MNYAQILLYAAIAVVARTVSAQTESQYILDRGCLSSPPDHRVHPCNGLVTWTTHDDPGALYARLRAALLADSLTPTSHDSSGKSAALVISPQPPHGRCAKHAGPDWITPLIAVRFDATRSKANATQSRLLVKGSAVSVEGNADGSSVLALCYLALYDAAIQGVEVPASTAEAPPPPAASAIRAGTWTYSARIETGAAHQDLRPRTVAVSALDKQDVSGWLVVMSTELEGHPVVDSVIMRRGDLTPLSRHAIIGSGDLMLVVDKGAAHGLLTVNTNLVPLNVALGPRSFLNYYALRVALTELPLKDGWTGQASIFDFTPDAAFAPLTLKVEGEEHLTEPAGEFECWRLGVSGPGINEHYWVAKQNGDVIRTREPIGDQGGILQLDLVSVVPHP